MIKLKSEINKTAVMRDLRKKAENMYEHTYEGELRIEDFMSGVNTLFNLLRLPLVTNRYLFWFEHEGKEGWTFEIEAKNYDEAFEKAYDTHGPQVEDMMYQLL